MTHSAERPDRETLAELLLRWEELYERGQDTSPAELAKDHPQVIGELARRIAALKSIAWIMKPPPDSPAADGTIPTRWSMGMRLGGRYRLDSLVAEGGFSEVYRAFDEELQRTVAVKVPKPGAIDSRDAFLAEARRIARLKHECIVPVYDVGAEGHTCFIITEFLEGGSLADRLADGPLPVTEAVRWIEDVADALEHAHLHGVVHRDVKPGNVLIDRHGRAKLADFGIAQSVSQPAATAPSLGTLRYMSPEQLAGKTSDHRSDIYSLGVVLHEALTGEVPYPSVEPQLLRRDIIAGSPRMCDRLPAPFLGVCRKALGREPHYRHPSAAEFAAELRRACGERGGGGTRGRYAWVVPLVSLALVAAVGFVAWRRMQKESSKEPSVTVAPVLISNEELLAEATNRFFQKNFVEAETLYTTYLERKPDDLEALTRRGLSRTGRGAFASGVQDFTKALAMKPDDVKLHRHRAMAYASLRQFELAIPDYERAVALDPTDRETQESFGACYSIMAAEKADTKEFGNAVELMNKAIAVYPYSAVFRHQRASCYFHSGEYEKALADLDEAIRMEPRKPDHHENRAHTLNRLGLAEEAEREFKKAEELRKQ